MEIRLKPLHEQVIVITGASSGIGRCAARMAAARGARVLLVARNERDLDEAVGEIHRHGGVAGYAVADVADADAVQAAADHAVREFGRIDTWINNAAVSMYGRVTEIDLADQRRLFDVNYWGVVHGCRAAVPHLRRQGGALITNASALADRAVPLQGVYCASKHAVKAFVEALRMELEEAGEPISVTLVKPASIDTPIYQKARTYLGYEPRPIPPVYDPEVAAEALLGCATRPVRELAAGGAGAALSLGARTFPRVMDWYMERVMFDQQIHDLPVNDGRPDNLYETTEWGGGERGHWEGHVLRSSVYTQARLHPLAATMALVGAGLALTAGLRLLRRRDDGRHAGGETAVAIPSTVEPGGAVVSRDVSSDQQLGVDFPSPAGIGPSADVDRHPLAASEGDGSNALTRDNT